MNTNLYIYIYIYIIYIIYYKVNLKFIYIFFCLYEVNFKKNNEMRIFFY
jgi:hypothetical protein